MQFLFNFVPPKTLVTLYTAYILYLKSKREREGEGERNGAHNSNVLTSESHVANPKSGPDNSVFITK
jgi:hypothetical protein